LLNSEYQDAPPKTDAPSDEVTTGSEEPQLAKRDKEPQLAKRYLESRLVMLNSEEQQKLLNMYANPLIRQQQQSL
jgi:hypothetical protein